MSELNTFLWYEAAVAMFSPMIVDRVTIGAFPIV